MTGEMQLILRQGDKEALLAVIPADAEALLVSNHEPNWLRDRDEIARMLDTGRFSVLPIEEVSHELA
jgi:hypothetical protein